MAAPAARRREANLTSDDRSAMDSSIKDDAADLDPLLAMQALANILGSQVLKQPSRQADILRYLVIETLEGRERNLKAYTIGVDVLGRSADFDPSTDSIVRVEMNRLRKTLELYSAAAKPGDIVIDIPKGQYRPHLRWVDGGPKPDTPRRRPKLALIAATILLLGAVVALTAILVQPDGGSRRAPGESDAPPAAAAERPPRPRLFVASASLDGATSPLMSELLNVMSRFEFVDLYDHAHRGEDGSWPEDYELRTQTHDGTIGDLSLAVVHLGSGQIILAETLSADMGTRTPDGDSLARVQRTAAWLVNIGGLLLTDYAHRGDVTENFRCTLLADDYFDHQTGEARQAARTCARQAIAAGDDDNPLLFQVLALMDREEYTDPRNQDPGNPLGRALAAAIVSTRLAPQSALGYYLQSSIYAVMGNNAAMVRTGRLAIELNPFDAELLGGFAARLNNAERFEEVLGLLERSVALSPTAGPWRDYAFFLAYYGQGRIDRAAEATAPLVGLNNPLFVAARVIAAARTGDYAAAAALLQELEELVPDIATDPGEMYRRRNYSPQLVEQLLAGLREAGL